MNSENTLVDKVIQGHILDAIKQIPDNYIDCIITSPPYSGLRKYPGASQTWDGNSNCEHEWGTPVEVKQTGGTKSEMVKVKGKENFQAFTASTATCIKCGAWQGQLGHEPTLALYISHLLQITAELWRVLKKSGTMFWVHGDTHGGSTCGRGSTAVNKGNKGSTCWNDSDIDPPQVNFQDRCLMMQSQRLVSRMCDEQNWILRNVITWKKPNAFTQSTKSRFTIDFEYVYFLTKTTDYYFEQQLEPYTTPMDRWGGDVLRANGYSLRDAGTGQVTYRTRNMRPNQHGRNMRCIWEINTKPLVDIPHFAAFAPDLVCRMIQAGCPQHICSKCHKPWVKEYQAIKHETMDLVGSVEDEIREPVIVKCSCDAPTYPGLVLDPFLGSGTTAIVAKQMHRNYLGIEASDEYVAIAEKRLAGTADQFELAV